MDRESTSCSIDVENTFGPIVAASCLDGFDFTLFFEETILTILPLSVAIFWCILSTSPHEPVKARGSWHLISKLLTYATYILLETTFLVIWIRSRTLTTAATLPATGLTMIGFVLLMIVSYFEHTRLVQPSTPLTVYLGLSLLLDLARVRTLYNIPATKALAPLFLSTFCVKIVIFMLELIEKRGLLKPEWLYPSTEATANVYSRAFFFWLNPLLLKGYHDRLELENLPPIDRAILSASQPASLIERWDQADKSKSYALLWSCVVHFRFELLAGVLPRLACIGFNFAQPFLIERALDLTESATPLAQNAAYGMVGAYAIVYIGLAVTLAFYEHKTYRALTMFRGSLIAVIYQKTLGTSSSAVPDAEAITLMSADIDRIGGSFHFLHEWYACLIELPIALWLIYRYLGVAMIAPTIIVAFFTLLSIPMATLAGNAQVQWLEAIVARLALTSAWLHNMKAMRMTGLAEYVAIKVADLRSSEVNSSLRYRLLCIILNFITTTSSMLTPLLAFGLYSLLAKSSETEVLTPGVAFATLSLLGLLEGPTGTIVDSFEHFQTLYRCFERIQDHLLTEERNDYRIRPADHFSEDRRTEPVPSPSKPHLDPETTNIIASVKDVSVWYATNETPTLTDLDFDIIKGSTTVIVGPVGSGKSTLLKLLLGEMPELQGSVRTSFLNAAFCPQAPWITSGTIRDNILGVSYMINSWYQTVIDACALSPDFEDLADGDQSQTGTRGTRLSGGQRMRISLARALYSRNPVLILDDVLAGLDGITERSVLDAVIGTEGITKQSSTTVVLTTHSVDHCRYADHIIVLDEHGRISRQGTLATCEIEGLDIGHMPSTKPAIPSPPELDEELKELIEVDKEANTSRGTSDFVVYAYYIRIIGLRAAIGFLLLCTLYIVTVNFSTIWLQWWANANRDHPNQDVGYWLGVYGVIAGAAVVGYFLSDCLFRLIMLPGTANKFHELLLTTTTHATTWFLTSTDVGNIMNRFSQDLELIDDDLPAALDQTILNALSVIAEAVLVCMGSSYLLVGIPICIVVLYLIQYYYLRTSRQLRLIDIEAKAPLFTQFLETLDGVASIRAFGWTTNQVEKNRKVLDESQKAYYLLWCIQRWLTLVLDLFVAGLAIALVGAAMKARTPYLGVALFSLISFSSTLQELVTEWTQLETAIGAVNRVRAFALDTKSEDDNVELSDLPPNWPNEGAICLTNVSAFYKDASTCVLEQVSFSILPGQKVAICGRTGSGKTSLLSAILRMLEIKSGQIFIDEIEIRRAPIQELRKRLNTIPQDQFLLPGTVRDNLDPLHLASDERIIEVLESLNLREWLNMNGGLEEELSEDSLSHAQRQIFSLARAILRPGQIVIMDEVASSVDADSEQMIQDLIRREFRHCTMLVAAHRLDTVLEFDQVIMMDKGRIVEMGNPRELLETGGSFFSRQYESL